MSYQQSQLVTEYIDGFNGETKKRLHEIRKAIQRIFPTTIEDIHVWLDIFANGITKNLTTKQKEIFKEEVEKILKNKIYSEEFGWLADYVRLRVVANKL